MNVFEQKVLVVYANNIFYISQRGKAGGIVPSRNTCMSVGTSVVELPGKRNKYFKRVENVVGYLGSSSHFITQAPDHNAGMVSVPFDE